jgi:hypothetical protein
MIRIKSLGGPLHLRSVLKKRELPPGVIAGPTYMSLTLEAACSAPVSCARGEADTRSKWAGRSVPDDVPAVHCIELGHHRGR